YLELQRGLEAAVLDLAAVERHWWTRALARVGGTGLAQAALAWRWSGHYDAVFVDRETTGTVLGALNRLRRKRPSLVMIGHLLTPRKKRLLFRGLGARHTVDRIIVHSTTQQAAAQTRLGLRPDQVVLLPYQTDTRFWAPRHATPKRQICSAGLEYRDYDTLVDAVRGLGVEVAIAAASHWSKHEAGLGKEPLPPNVRIMALDYAALRDLYAESLFVVVPLHDSDNQAGITTILEAMAMGKAVVVSHARGQTDVVRDRRHLSRSHPQRPTQPEWARLLGAADETANGHTGIYVRPYDREELRRAIAFLLEHPEQAAIMGANGRRLVEETMGLDHFVERVTATIRQEQPVLAGGPNGEAAGDCGPLVGTGGTEVPIPRDRSRLVPASRP
ncbi:MAG TPA: glycosyltransferase family 4 protein, partial [Chloroflexota bacterium]|nr:glycosyltransferase family 4 protein [Chloroflexota bacterium]